MTNWLLQTILIYLCQSQILPTNWNDDGCIPENEYFICITLVQLRSLNDIRQIVSYINIELESETSNLSPIYSTDWYLINQNTESMGSLSTCFYPDSTTNNDHPFIDFNIYYLNNNSNSKLLASHSMNIKALNLSGMEAPILFNDHWNFNVSQSSLNLSWINTIPQTRYYLWRSSSQCIEITTGIMYFANDYRLNTNFYRFNKDKNEIAENRIFETSKFTKLNSLNTSPTFNSIFCLPLYPTNKSSEALIGANFTLNDGTTSKSYSLSRINNDDKYYISPTSFWKQTSFDSVSLYFPIGKINMKYWQSCSLTNLSYQIFDSTQDNILYFNDRFENIAEITMEYTISLLAILLLIIMFCIIGGCYTCKSYRNTDKIHYSNMLWCLLSIWDFFSQILFVIFLVYLFGEPHDEEIKNENEILLILFILILSFLLISYLCNLLYLIHYLQIWNDALAPGCTRHWLELWAWLLIFLTMTMGGVTTALELSNSVLIPIDIFCMHLSHSELVRCRKDRFITTTIMQDIPILIIIFIYLFIFHGGNDMNNYDQFFDIKYIVIINVLICTLISVIATSIFRFIRRNYSHDNPVAQYQFSFTLKSNEWKSHWIHSHQKIQKCFKTAFALRKLSLTVIDQCSESLNAMKIEGRLLRDEKWRSERVENMATGDVTENEMRQIGLDLLKQFKQEFDLLYSDDIIIDHLVIKTIIGGEIVYNHSTCVQILCIGLKDCLQSICHKLCPSFIKSPPSRRQSSAAVAHAARSQALSVDSIVAPSPTTTLNNTLNPPQPPHVNIVNTSANNNSTNHLPMITISSRMEDLRDSIDETNPNDLIRKHIKGDSFEFRGQNPGYIDKRANDRKVSQYKSPKENISPSDYNGDSAEPSRSSRAKLDQQTLFADVYNENGLKELAEDEEESPPAHNPPTINPQEWYAQMYNQIKNKDRKTTNEYGYESSRKIQFKSADDRVKEIAGDAPVAFSVSTNNLIADNSADIDIDEEEQIYYDDDNGVDI